MELPADERVDSTEHPGLAARQSTISRIFFDDEGLRAVWGILLFLAIRECVVYSLFPLLQNYLAMERDRGEALPPRFVYAYEGVGLIAVAAATWLMARIERRPVRAYGFGGKRRALTFCAGLGWGVTLLSLLVVVLRVAGLLVFDGRQLLMGGMLHYGAIWLGGFLLVALAEESTSRGYLQFAGTRLSSGIYRRLFGVKHADALGFWTAAVALSFAFGFGHRTNPGESPLGLLAAGAAGLVFCFSLWWSGSLWWAIGFHAAWDWAQSFLYGVADSGLMVQGHLYATHPVGRPWLSGGVTGPEGSIFLMPVLGVGVVAVMMTLPRARLETGRPTPFNAALD